MPRHEAPDGPGITVDAVIVADTEVVGALAALIPQLSSSSPAPSAYDLETMLQSPATTLFVARNSERRIVGALTLAVFRIPTGVRALIEDVVVDASARRSGVGAALVAAALKLASESGAKTVDLTSRPDREAANQMYVALGFEQRTTNVYRKSLIG